MCDGHLPAGVITCLLIDSGKAAGMLRSREGDESIEALVGWPVE